MDSSPPFECRDFAPNGTGYATQVAPPMRISFISKTAVPSTRAESIYVMQMCQAYSALGHEVTLIIPNHPVQIPCDDVFSFYGVDHRFKIRKVAFPSWCPDLISFGMQMPIIAALSKSDLVHSRSVAPAWGALKFFNIPTIYEIHTGISENSRQRRLFKKVTSSKNLRAIVVLTRSLAEHVRPLVANPDLRILVAPDGIESTLLNSKINRDSARRALGLWEDQRRIAVYTGHLYPGRGIELIQEIAKKVPDHEFLIVGGRDVDVLKYKNSSDGSGNLHFLGFKPPSEIFPYLGAADVLLMPYGMQVQVASGGDISRFFSPMKMFQYMASGRPILSSDLMVLREILQDQVNALLLPHNDVHAWVDALRKLQHDQQLSARIADRAKEDVKSYTWENRAKIILNGNRPGTSPDKEQAP